MRKQHVIGQQLHAPDLQEGFRLLPSLDAKRRQTREHRWGARFVAHHERDMPERLQLLIRWRRKLMEQTAGGDHRTAARCSTRTGGFRDVFRTSTPRAVQRAGISKGEKAAESQLQAVTLWYQIPSFASLPLPLTATNEGKRTKIAVSCGERGRVLFSREWTRVVLSTCPTRSPLP